MHAAKPKRRNFQCNKEENLPSVSNTCISNEMSKWQESRYKVLTQITAILSSFLVAFNHSPFQCQEVVHERRRRWKESFLKFLSKTDKLSFVIIIIIIIIAGEAKVSLSLKRSKRFKLLYLKLWFKKI